MSRFNLLPRWIERMPAVHQLVFVAVLGGMFAGDSRVFYPFIKWDIFGYRSEQDPVTCRELWASTASGRGVRLLVEQLFPSIVQFDLPPGSDSPTLTHLVAALAGAYDQRHPDDPVRQVDLVDIAVRLHPRAGSHELPACEILHHYDLSSAPWP